MPKYRVVVTLTISASIECRNETDAEELAMMYVGQDGDLSTAEERKKMRFKITDVEAESVDASVLYKIEKTIV